MVKINPSKHKKNKDHGLGNNTRCKENGYLWKVIAECRGKRGPWDIDYIEYTTTSVSTGEFGTWFSDEPEVEVVELDDGKDDYSE